MRRQKRLEVGQQWHSLDLASRNSRTSISAVAIASSTGPVARLRLKP